MSQNVVLKTGNWCSELFYRRNYRRKLTKIINELNKHPGLARGQIVPLLNCSFSFYLFELKLGRIVEHEIF